MTRESLEKLYADGFRPAVVLESSPGNYQCVLTIPKLQSPHDRDVGNRITERLNREYGDKKLSGCIHPHRAPGFGNLKPKHRREDGSFPKVKLLKAEKRECAKALELSRRIEREYAEADKVRKAYHDDKPSTRWSKRACRVSGIILPCKAAPTAEEQEPRRYRARRWRKAPPSAPIHLHSPARPACASALA